MGIACAILLRDLSNNRCLAGASLLSLCVTHSNLVKMRIVNKPDVSGPLKWFYLAAVALLAIIAIPITYSCLQAQMTQAIIGLIVLIGMEIVMLSLLASLCGTEYILTSEELVIKASVLIGGTKTIPLETIESVERTHIPFGFRIFGASFYGGYYYLPGIGSAFLVMTNFKDGVLVKSKQGTYVITPRNPEKFMGMVKNAEKNGVQPDAEMM